MTLADSNAVLLANEAFYRAFIDRDLAAMEALWSRIARIACIHPGWNPVIGREAVMASWKAILQGPQAPQIRCQSPQAVVLGDAAFVICYEIIGRAALVATNLFAREAGAWRVVHHQATPAASPPPEEIAPPKADRVH